MPGASLPEIDLLATWTDNFDNWRSVDADFLQKRSVLRFSNQTVRSNILGPSSQLPSPSQGQVTYVGNGGVDGNGGIEYADASGTWRSLLSVKNLAVNDTSSGFGMRINSDSSAVVSLETNRVVLGTSRILSVELSNLVFKTGVATAQLSTDADSFVSDIKIKAPSAALGAITGSTAALSGALTAGSVTSSGALSGLSLTVSGSSALGTSATVGTMTVAGGVTAVTVFGSTSVRGGSVLMSSSRVANNSAVAQYVELAAATTTVGGDTVLLSPTSQTSAVRFRGPSGAPFALVVVSATDPGLSNYPDGTIWVQP